MRCLNVDTISFVKGDTLNRTYKVIVFSKFGATSSYILMRKIQNNIQCPIWTLQLECYAFWL